MVEAANTLDDLQARRALDLYIANNPDSKWMKPVQSPNNFEFNDEAIPTEEFVEAAAQRTLSNNEKWDHTALGTIMINFSIDNGPGDTKLVESSISSKVPWPSQKYTA
jgi:hypothetical protein